MNGAANKALVAIGGILVIAGTFFPWAEIDGITLSGFALSYLAWLVLAFGVIGMLLGLTGKTWGSTGAFAFGLIGFVLLGLNVYLVWGTGTGGLLGYGIYTTIAGTLILAIGGIWGWTWAKRRETELLATPEPTPLD
jgi:peptidoglycan/LPS O-acetylase OafA/YrhL